MTDEEKKYLLKRLNVIQGQINGIKQMINDDRTCNDILIQISAVNKSLKGLGNTMVKNYLTQNIETQVNNSAEDTIENIIYLYSVLNK